MLLEGDKKEFKEGHHPYKKEKGTLFVEYNPGFGLDAFIYNV